MGSMCAAGGRAPLGTPLTAPHFLQKQVQGLFLVQAALVRATCVPLEQKKVERKKK